MREWIDIVRIVQDLEARRGPVILRMAEILKRYDGDWVLPMPDVKTEPKMPPLTPMLIADSVDDAGRRAASVNPTVYIPALDPAKMTGKRSVEYAQIRRRALASTYEKSKWQLGRRRYYRHLAAYQTCSLVVVPDFTARMPRLQVRDPLATFVEPRRQESLEPPEFVAFVTVWSGAHIRSNYPVTQMEQGGPISAINEQMSWKLLEWIDMDQTRWGLLGPVEPNGWHVADQWRSQPFMPISKPYPNRLGMIPAVCPENVSLGKIAGRMAAMLGNVDLQAKLVALNILAQEKAIFPDVYAIGRENAQPRIVGGAWQDGRTGSINMLEDVDRIGTLSVPADQQTSQMIDRLERNFRVSNGPVPQAGGETYGALRTGRGIDALAGMAVEPRIQELHEITQAWMPHINEAILQTYKTYWGAKKYSMFSGWAGDRGQLNFTPDVHVETLDNSVSYTIAGADVIQQTQILGSMLGAKVISVDTFRDKHQWIENPDAEKNRIDAQDLEDALRQSIAEKLISGQMDIKLALMVYDNVTKGDSIFTAMTKANDVLQKQQASQAPPTPDGLTAPPAAMPGVDGGPGATQAPSPAPAPGIVVPPDAQAMRQLMTVMGPRRGQPSAA